MLHDAPQVLIALEQSAFAHAIRASTWGYMTANVGHILALMLFVSSVAVMDARLIGAFAATPPASVVRPARRVAALGLLLMAGTGFTLFAAEATHVATNPVFQIKLALIVLGILNALLAGRLLREALDHTPAFTPLPGSARLHGVLSLLIWFATAACGRLIAYF
jgi:hypothetical protein